MIKKSLTTKERQTIGKVIDGKADPNANQNKTILERPHVAIAIEAILDRQDLTDDKMARRVKEIINRKQLKSINTKTGTASTNQTAVDANALNAVRTIWQLRGKFKPDADGKGGLLAGLPEEMLDKIIEGGMSVVKVEKIQRTANDSTDRDSNNSSRDGANR